MMAFGAELIMAVNKFIIIRNIILQGKFMIWIQELQTKHLKEERKSNLIKCPLERLIHRD